MQANPALLPADLGKGHADHPQTARPACLDASLYELDRF